MKNAFFALLFLGIQSCVAQSTDSIRLEAADFEKAIDNNAIQLLDVRTADEYKSGHIAHALQADWTQQSQFIDRVQYLDKNKPVYVYCLAGGRSAAAANWMRTNGFLRVIELVGGIKAWKTAGKPVEGNSPVPQLTLAQYMTSIPTDKPVLVDFGAEWCPPCVKMKPVIDELQQNKSIEVIKIDAGVHTDLMKALSLDPIPVFIVYKNGKETWRKQGIVTKEELMAQLK